MFALLIGCYWGTEKFFKQDFGTAVFPGCGSITSGRVGFMGPPTAKKNPVYSEVAILYLSVFQKFSDI